MENRNIEEIREENEMEQNRIDAMTPDERKSYYENMRACVEVMQSVLCTFTRKWLDFCLHRVSECAENEDWKNARNFMEESKEALDDCYTEMCHRTVWESLGEDVPDTLADSEFLRLLEELRKLNGAESELN